MYKKAKQAIIGDYLNDTKRPHDRSRITLLFNIAFSCFILGSLATITSLVLGTYPILIPALGNVIFALIPLALLKRKRLDLAAKIYFSVLFCLLFGNLNFNDGTMHVGSPFWIVIVNILVMYILDYKWGITFLTLSAFGFIYYLNNVLPHTLEVVGSLPKGTYYSAYYESFFALFLIGYIVATILKASRHSDELLQAQNDALTLQNNLIKSSDEEKTVMLKEIHHRVKNNLQVIISLLRLQMREINDADSITKFRDSINRVLTMALIHEKIYQSEELSRVNLEKYFESLSQDLIASHQIEFPVKVQFDFEVEKIGLRSIVPLALIFNELFTNSLKHAFTDHRNPLIHASLKMFDDTFFIFEYMDNGAWKSSSDTSSFGLELIESLTDQLEGEMEFENHPKTFYKFKIKHLEL